MNIPSRRMPPPKVRKTLGWFGGTVFFAIVAGFLGCLLWSLLRTPLAAWIIGSLSVLYGILMLRSHRQWRQWEMERKQELICNFARTLPARGRDTWVVRAVYEELSREVGLSIRPLDKLETDLGIALEDFDDCLDEIARRAGRSLEDGKKNPFFDRVTTVADLVSFLEYQPKT